MSESTNTIETFANQEYKWGFVTDIEADAIPRGLSEDVVRLISAKKQEPEWLLDWRLKAYRHWLTLKEPEWANVHYPKINYQDIIYYSSPKPKGEGRRAWTTSIPNCSRPTPSSASPQEQAMLAGVAVGRRSTAFPSPPPSRPNCTKSASSSDRSPKPSKSIPTSSANISDR